MPIAILIAAMFCFQLGAVIAKGMFPAVGAAGTTALRMALASLMLLAVWRPWRMRLSPRDARVIVIYGLAMGCMNFCFYLSLSTIPLGIAVALDEQLQTAAVYYDRELDYKIKKFTSLFEPAVIIVMGVVVGFVAVALVSAMYGIYKQVKV